MKIRTVNTLRLRNSFQKSNSRNLFGNQIWESFENPNQKNLSKNGTQKTISWNNPKNQNYKENSFQDFLFVSLNKKGKSETRKKNKVKNKTKRTEQKNQTKILKIVLKNLSKWKVSNFFFGFEFFFSSTLVPFCFQNVNISNDKVCLPSTVKHNLRWFFFCNLFILI